MFRLLLRHLEHPKAVAAVLPAPAPACCSEELAFREIVDGPGSISRSRSDGVGACGIDM